MADEQSWVHRPLLALHAASTGLDPQRDRLVAVGLAAGNIPETWSRTLLVHPRVPIPVAASNAHGVSTGRARRDGRDLADVLGDLWAVLRVNADQELPLAVFSARWALTLLEREAERAQVKLPLDQVAVVDPLLLDLHSHPVRGSGQRTMAALARTYRLGRARTDQPVKAAQLTARLAWAYARAHPPVAAMTARALHEAQRTWWVEYADAANQFREERGRVERIGYSWPVQPPPGA